MSWEIILAPEVHDWFLGLDDLNASLVRDAVELLAERGPALGRPLADRITGSRLHNLKELRPGSAGRTEMRILYIFDTQRRAASCWSRATSPAAGTAGTAMRSSLPRTGTRAT